MTEVDDVEAIRRLKARYFRTMDVKDWAGMRQLFTDDVVIDTSEAGGDVVRGADEFIAFLDEALGGAVTVHQGHMPEIDLTSETTATGIRALNDIVIGPMACASTATAIITRPTRRAPTGGGKAQAHPAAH